MCTRVCRARAWVEFPLCLCTCSGEKHIDAELKLLDFETVGLGSGPQDIGQYLISNISPEKRRELEPSIVCSVY